MLKRPNLSSETIEILITRDSMKGCLFSEVRQCRFLPSPCSKHSRQIQTTAVGHETHKANKDCIWIRLGCIATAIIRLKIMLQPVNMQIARYCTTINCYSISKAVAFKNPDQGNNKENEKCRRSDSLALFYLMNQHRFGGIINAGNIRETYYMPPWHSNLLINHLLVTWGLEAQGLYLVLYIFIDI